MGRVDKGGKTGFSMEKVWSEGVDLGGAIMGTGHQ